MKKIAPLLLLLVSFYTEACSDLLNTEMRVLDSSEKVNLCQYTDQVVLVVNVASRCGYTYQYSSLQKLYEDFTKKNRKALKRKISESTIRETESSLSNKEFHFNC